jgi:hypothetical protein
MHNTQGREVIFTRDVLKDDSYHRSSIFEIYFRDLNRGSQIRLLEMFNTTEKDENWDIFPIAVIEREV